MDSCRIPETNRNVTDCMMVSGKIKLVGFATDFSLISFILNNSVPLKKKKADVWE